MLHCEKLNSAVAAHEATPHPSSHTWLVPGSPLDVRDATDQESAKCGFCYTPRRQHRC